MRNEYDFGLIEITKLQIPSFFFLKLCFLISFNKAQILIFTATRSYHARACFTASVGIVNTHVNQNFLTIQNFQNSCLKGQLFV